MKYRTRKRTHHREAMRAPFRLALMTAALGAGVAMPTDSATAANAANPLPERYAGYIVVGEIERVTIYPDKIDIRAKVDTGAKTSSIDAEVLESSTRDGTNWVRVRIYGDEGRTHEVELPVVRYVRIRRAGVPVEERPVVKMRVCLGTVMTDAEVNLAERRRLSYRMLLGRDLLAGRFLVDPGEDFLTQPFCDDEETK